jgi:predicted small secreted protein
MGGSFAHRGGGRDTLSRAMRRHALPILVAASALLVTACGGSTVDTAGLTRVQISSYQSLPPPYGSRQATLTSPSSLTAFQQAIAQDRIGMSGSSTVSTGCTGGIQYTVIMDRGGAASTTLSEYSCAEQLTGNMTGDVAAFLTYLDGQLSGTPSDQG